MAVAKTTTTNIVDRVIFTFILIMIVAADILYKRFPESIYIRF
jgi:hypothetical protein